MIELIVFAMGILYKRNELNDLEYLVMYCYIMTPLVSQTLAERLVISDNKSVRYMSKQNVHQNLLRKIITNIMNLIRTEMPKDYERYFPNNFNADALIQDD